ncbi:MAG: NAD(+)/NADH kinase [Chitinophagaceae bacterium]
MQVAIYGRLIKKDALPYVQQLFDLLNTRNIKCLIHEEYYPHLVNNIQFKQQPEIFYEKEKDKIKNIDFMFSVGGDGTLLDTITIVKDTKVPIVGINIGRLGFLASIGKDGIEDMIDALGTRNI